MPVYLCGTLKSVDKWIAMDDPCDLCPETNLYFARVCRHLNQSIVFKFKVGNDELGSYYEPSTIYENDGSAYKNNKLSTEFISVCEANY